MLDAATLVSGTESLEPFEQHRVRNEFDDDFRIYEQIYSPGPEDEENFLSSCMAAYTMTQSYMITHARYAPYIHNGWQALQDIRLALTT
jgi:hypothetical protein